MSDARQVERIKEERAHRDAALRTHIIKIIGQRGRAYSREVWETSDKFLSVQQVQHVMAAMESERALESFLRDPIPGQKGMQRRYYRLPMPDGVEGGG